MSIRERTYQILETARPGDLASKAFDVFILSLIALNVLALAVETVDSIYERAPAFFYWFEICSIAVFTVEYLMRLWSCTSNPRYGRPIRGRLRFAVTPLALIDFLAVAPFYLPFLGLDLRFIRAVRLARVFRVAKVGRYSAALQTLGRVLSNKKAELGITLFVLVLLLVMASSLMYFAEHEAQPEQFSSIPATMWWAVATLTTVGYGDVFPITWAGKLLASVIAVLGIGMFALPTGILGAGFVEEIRRGKSQLPGKQITCPHCGKTFDQSEVPPGT